MGAVFVPTAVCLTSAVSLSPTVDWCAVEPDILFVLDDSDVLCACCCCCCSFSKSCVLLPLVCSDGVAARLLVFCRAGRSVTFVAIGSSPFSRVLASSGTPQHPRIERSPPLFFFFWEEVAAGELGWEVPGLLVGLVPPADCLLEALPFRLRPTRLPLDSLECPPMLSLGSLAVAPLRPVEVGEG